MALTNAESSFDQRTQLDVNMPVHTTKERTVGKKTTIGTTGIRKREEEPSAAWEERKGKRMEFLVGLGSFGSDTELWEIKVTLSAEWIELSLA